MLSDIVKSVICGLEHSGTTLLAQLIRQHPLFDTGFEVGALLYDTPHDFLNTSSDWNNLEVDEGRALFWAGWKLPETHREAFYSCETFEEFYRLLQKVSPLVRNKDGYLIDKTPSYYDNLAYILEQHSVKVIVVKKDPVLLRASKHLQATYNMDEYIDWYYNKMQKIDNAIQNYPQKTLEIHYEDLITKSEELLEIIFDFVEIEPIIQTEFETDFVEKTGNRIWDSSKLDDLYLSIDKTERERIIDELGDYLYWKLEQ